MTETLTHSDLGIDDLDALYPAGEPLPESRPHEIRRTDAVTVLRDHFSDSDDVCVASNCNLYWREGVPTAVVEPDLMVITDVAAERLDEVASYRTWQHGGTVRFVLEFASEETANVDRGHKRDVYAAIGVTEYWRVDPTGGELASEVLHGERLCDGRWGPISVTVDGAGTWRGHSESLDLDIAWRHRELIFYPPGSDQPLHNLARAGTALRAEQAARRASETALRASEAAYRGERQARRAAERKAEAQAAENARLRELLRRQGSPEAGRPQDPPG